MSHDHPGNSQNTAAHEATDSLAFNLTARQLADLEDEATQAEYRQAYLEQLQQRACPGCGDEGI